MLSIPQTCRHVLTQKFTSYGYVAFRRQVQLSRTRGFIQPGPHLLSPGSSACKFPGANSLPAITLSIRPPRVSLNGEQLKVMANTTPGCMS